MVQPIISTDEAKNIYSNLDGVLSQTNELDQI